jgi:multisubunit Na+/H+ antiporter MnhE subunit
MVPALTLTWAFMWGDFAPGTLLFGALLGAAALRVAGDHFPWAPSPREVARAIPRFLRYLVRFLWALVMANLQVAWILVRPRLRIRPGILAFKTRHRSELGATMLGSSITLTPGTLTMDVTPEGDVLYIHVLDVSHPDQVREAIRRGLEDYTLEVIP